MNDSAVMNTDSEIAYQNKDITAKYLMEGLKGKTLKAYGRPELEVVNVLPTNLPAIEANELRIDNLLLFSDGSIGIIDYESSYTWEDKVKHINYIARILKRYVREGIIDEVDKIRLIIIFTADIEKVDTLTLDVGCMKVYIEPIYLVGMDTKEVLKRLRSRAECNTLLADEELMELIILPLAVKGIEAKRELVVEAIEIAKAIKNEKQRLYTISGILTFSDKFIDKEFAQKVRENIMILQVIQSIISESEANGEVRGEARGKTELIGVIRKKIMKGHTALIISELLELPIQEVEEIYIMIHNNPADTDLQIAERLLRVKEKTLV